MNYISSNVLDHTFSKQILNKYFAGLVFTRVDEKEGFAIYAAGIECRLVGFNRYILAFVRSQYASKSQAFIHELDYENIQTRQLSYSYRLRKQTFHCPPPRCIDPMFVNIKRTEKESTYASDEVSFKITMLHEAKKQTKYQYNNKLNLSASIAMFNTIIDISQDTPPSYDTNIRNAGFEPVFTSNDSFEVL